MLLNSIKTIFSNLSNPPRKLRLLTRDSCDVKFLAPDFYHLVIIFIVHRK